MRFLVWFVLIAAAAVAAALWLGPNDGLVSVYWKGWRGDVSLNLFLVVLLVTAVVLVLALRALHALLSLPERAHAWRVQRREQVAQAALRESLERFAEGVVMVWLPQVQLVQATQLPQRLKAAADAGAKKGWLHARLTVAQADARGFGMMGSSVFIANPPHTLFEQLQPVLPWLAQALAQFEGATSALDRSRSA